MDEILSYLGMALVLTGVYLIGVPSRYGHYAITALVITMAMFQVIGFTWRAFGGSNLLAIATTVFILLTNLVLIWITYVIYKTTNRST